MSNDCITLTPHLTAIKAAIKASDELREKIWQDRGFPVDPVTIANELGIKVLETDLPKNAYGALIKEQGQDPVIVVHQFDSTNRKRFTCAHELGHFIYRLQEDNDLDIYEYVDLRSQLSSCGENEMEIFANNFAANLLMPEKEVKRIYKTEQGIEIMALYFDVSAEAMNFRLKNLKLN